jgi:hypothetical protein
MRGLRGGVVHDRTVVPVEPVHDHWERREMYHTEKGGDELAVGLHAWSGITAGLISLIYTPFRNCDLPE